MAWVPYLPSLQPTGLTGQVGGPPGDVYKGYMDELFCYAELTGACTQYRKIYFKNTYAFPLQSGKVFLTEIEHTGQLAIATGSFGSTGYVESLPSDAGAFSSPTSYEDGIDVGTVDSDGYASVWVRLVLTTGEDPFAYARIAIGGIAG